MVKFIRNSTLARNVKSGLYTNHTRQQMLQKSSSLRQIKDARGLINRSKMNLTKRLSTTNDARNLITPKDLRTSVSNSATSVIVLNDARSLIQLSSKKNNAVLMSQDARSLINSGATSRRVQGSATPIEMGTNIFGVLSRSRVDDVVLNSNGLPVMRVPRVTVQNNLFGVNQPTTFTNNNRFRIRKAATTANAVQQAIMEPEVFAVTIDNTQQALQPTLRGRKQSTFRQNFNVNNSYLINKSVRDADQQVVYKMPRGLALKRLGKPNTLNVAKKSPIKPCLVNPANILRTIKSSNVATLADKVVGLSNKQVVVLRKQSGTGQQGKHIVSLKQKPKFQAKPIEAPGEGVTQQQQRATMVALRQPIRAPSPVGNNVMKSAMMQQQNVVTNIQGGFKIRIDNLHHDVTIDDVKELFGSVGTLRNAVMLSDSSAEVVFIKKADALLAMEQFNQRELDGMPMQLTLIQPQANTGGSFANKNAQKAGQQGGIESRLGNIGGFRGSVQPMSRSWNIQPQTTSATGNKRNFYQKQQQNPVNFQITI